MVAMMLLGRRSGHTLRSGKVSLQLLHARSFSVGASRESDDGRTASTGRRGSSSSSRGAGASVREIELVGCGKRTFGPGAGRAEGVDGFELLRAEVFQSKATIGFCLIRAILAAIL